MTIVSISGFGNTGASAVVDFLKQIDGLKVFDKFEFQLLHQPDGINDLKYHLTKNKERVSSNVAIKRFVRLLKKSRGSKKIKRILGKDYKKWYSDFLLDLIDVTWKGESSSFDPVDISNKPQGSFASLFYRIDRLFKRINKSFHLFRHQQKYFSLLTEEEFDVITKKHLKILFKKLNLCGDNVVVDMLFSSTNPLQGSEFFDAEVKSIVVVRDPRDVYVTSKLHPDDSRFMPNDTVEHFCIYYKKIRDTLLEMNNVLILKYEDLIYQYAEIKKTILSFLKVNEDRMINEMEFFDPTYSVKFTNGTELYKIHAEDVEYIACNLQKYLYDFGSVCDPRQNNSSLSFKKNSNYKGLKQK